MFKEWEVVALEQVAEEITVGHVGPMATAYKSNGIPFLRSQNVEPGRILLDEVKFIDEEFHQKLGKSALKPGDVVIVRTGKPGATAVVPRTLPVANCADLVIVRPGPNLNSQFAAYFINTVAVHHVAAHLVGAVQQHFNVASARMMKMHLPSVSEQEAIVSIVGTLDDKIDLNRRMNQTFDAIARAIFKSWFVDFDPLREECVAAPRAFQELERGEGPKDWQFRKMHEVVAVNAVSVGPSYSHEDIEYVDISSVREGYLEGSKNFKLKSAPSRARQLVTSGDTIWSCVRPNRRSFLYVHNPPANMVVSTGFAVLSPRDIPPAYLYQWVTTDAFVDFLTANADGSAYPAVRPSTFGAADILIPPDSVLNKFQEVAGPLRERIAGNDEESRTLAALRDTLLPKLLTGEIRVKQAEKLVGEAV